VILTGTMRSKPGRPPAVVAGSRRACRQHLLLVKNRLGRQPRIKFMTFKPENWKVEFKPERIDLIEPNGSNRWR